MVSGQWASSMIFDRFAARFSERVIDGAHCPEIAPPSDWRSLAAPRSTICVPPPG
jgi:hypothetical protein